MNQKPVTLEEVAEAVQIANDAPAVEAVDPTTGEPVKSVRVKMTAAQTKQIMSAPPAARAAMAEAILAQRADDKMAERKADYALAKRRKDRKAKRKRTSISKRRNR